MKTVTILFVDDDVRVLELLKRYLHEEKYDILTAANGNDGIETARTRKPDIIFCDIMMPELDGYGVLSALQKDDTTGTIPFYFLTSKVQKEDILLGITAGATGYLAKPTSRQQLLEALQENGY
jgi:CRP/FNR family cyclic AMP-dependent transcriptional regulator